MSESGRFSIGISFDSDLKEFLDLIAKDLNTTKERLVLDMIHMYFKSKKSQIIKNLNNYQIKIKEDIQKEITNTQKEIDDTKLKLSKLNKIENEEEYIQYSEILENQEVLLTETYEYRDSRNEFFENIIGYLEALI